jgi:competence protein ComEA
VPELSVRSTAVVVVGAVALAVLAGVFFARSPVPVLPVPSVVVPSEEAIVAHVSGAVRQPGLVSLTAPARVADAIESAGGATGAADLGAINLATAVADGDQIVVPIIGDPGVADNGLIDLNRATGAELAELDGIGPVLAERIIAYREEHGPFEAIEDLLDVPGIGEAKLAMLRPGVSVP